MRNAGGEGRGVQACDKRSKDSLSLTIKFTAFANQMFNVDFSVTMVALGTGPKARMHEGLTFLERGKEVRSSSGTRCHMEARGIGVGLSREPCPTRLGWQSARCTSQGC